MFSSRTAKTFEEIRSALDPCFSYIIVEGEDNRVTEEEIREALELLPVQSDDITNARMYRESRTGRPLLVARLTRDRRARIKETIIVQGIAPHLTLYYYGRGLEGEGHDIERL